MNKKILLITVILIFPIIIFAILDFINITNYLPFTDRYDWLAFIGAAIGGIIGGLFTYIGVKITIEDNKRIHELENQKNVLPLIKLENIEYDYKYKYISFDFLYTEESKKRKAKDIVDTEHISFMIKNVGERELYDLHLADFNSTYFFTECDSFELEPIIYKNDGIGINFNLYEKGKYDNDNLPYDLNDTIISPITFNVYFKDCYNNWYYQTVQINLFHQIIPGKGLKDKALNASIKDFKVLSSPIEILSDGLPWNKKDSKNCICM